MFRHRRYRGRRANPAGQLPEWFGAREAGMRLARAIEQFAVLRLLIANDKSRSKCAVAALLFRQTSCPAGDDIREKRLVCHDVIGLAEAILQLRQR